MSWWLLVCNRTCSGLELVDLKRPASEEQDSSTKDGKSSGRYPPRLRLDSNRSKRLLSAAFVKPHQSEEAYSCEATVVILAMRWSYVGCTNSKLQRDTGCYDSVDVFAHGKTLSQSHTQDTQSVNPHNSSYNRFVGWIVLGWPLSDYYHFFSLIGMNLKVVLRSPWLDITIFLRNFNETTGSSITSLD